MRVIGRIGALLVVLQSSCINKDCADKPQGPRAIIGTAQKILSPFPADRLTLPDPSTPTGLRVDVPMKDDFTALERTLVTHANTLDGFGVFSPLCVRFDQPLDLATITPEAFWLVKVSDGTRVPLDLWDNAFPTELAQSVWMFPNDIQDPSLILAPENRVTFYEDRTNALILRPRVPLEPATRYLVLLSRHLKGTNGHPIEAPPNEPPTPAEFADFTTVMQWLDLAPIEVAFYWTFTTHSVTRELEAIRKGMDGEGPLRGLASQYPAKITSLLDLERPLLDGNRYTFDAPVASALFELINALAHVIEPAWPDLKKVTTTFYPFIADLKNVDYFVFGSIEPPNFIENEEGIFHLDLHAGTAQTSAVPVPFMLSVPKPTPENNYAQPPYPVVILGHGLTVSRLNVWPMANRLAAQGLAMACVDLVGHGPMEQFYVLPRILKSLDGPTAALAKPVLLSIGLLLGCPVNPLKSLSEMTDDLFSCGLLAPIFGEGRSKDVDGDGELDPTQAFFSSDFFQMRDNFRQCVIDLMHLTRVMRNLGRDLNHNRRLDREEGDFDGDGVADLGTAALPLTYAGISLGSIIGGVVMGVDPLLQTGVLNVAGGGLGDIMFRTAVLNEPVVQRVVRDVFGLAIVGRPSNGQVHLTFNQDSIESAFWSVPADVTAIEVRNLAKGTRERARTSTDRNFFAIVTADVGDPLEIIATSPTGHEARHTVPAPVLGLGTARGSTRSREFLMLLSWFMESADPVCYAPHWWQHPLDGVPEKNILMQLACGDPVVPTASGLSLARAAGLISTNRMSELIARGIPTGGNEAVDVALPAESNQYRALRFHASGKHAYIVGGNERNLENSVKMGMAAQNQMARFITSVGAEIIHNPVFDLVLPDDNGTLLFDLPLPSWIPQP